MCVARGGPLCLCNYFSSPRQGENVDVREDGLVGRAREFERRTNGRGRERNIDDESISYLTCKLKAIPIIAEKVALPERAGTVDLLSLLPPDVACLYSAPSSQLLRAGWEGLSLEKPMVRGSREDYVL